MKLRSSWPVVASIMRSIRGRGKLSFRQARLTSIKSMLPFAICLLDENHISQPVRLICFSDSSGLEEFADLFVDRLLPFWGETSSFLFDGLEGGGNIQLVGDNCRVNSSHVLLLPSKYFHILL